MSFFVNLIFYQVFLGCKLKQKIIIVGWAGVIFVLYRKTTDLFSLSSVWVIFQHCRLSITEHATQILSILHKHVLNKLVKFKIEASELENKIEIYINPCSAARTYMCALQSVRYHAGRTYMCVSMKNRRSHFVWMIFFYIALIFR